MAIDIQLPPRLLTPSSDFNVLRRGSLSPGELRSERQRLINDAFAPQRESQLEAERFASTEAEREREFIAEQRRDAFSRIANIGTGPTSAEQSGIDEIEATIERRGETAQGQLSSQLARRGIFRSGPGAAESRRLTADIESNIATTRGQFAERIADRRLQERLAILQSIGSFS